MLKQEKQMSLLSENVTFSFPSENKLRYYCERSNKKKRSSASKLQSKPKAGEKICVVNFHIRAHVYMVHLYEM